MNVHTRFVVIDDDEFNNKICIVTISKISRDTDIKTFVDPEKGLKHIVDEYADNDKEAILFLDINMPVMNGWEFLEIFEKFQPELKSRIKIYILSSSVDNRDIQRSKEFKSVVQYLVKPLTPETIRLVTYSQNRNKK